MTIKFLKPTLKLIPLFPVIAILLTACVVTNERDLTEQSKQEIAATEHAFAQMAKEQGISAAFLAYAADEAVINRGNKLYKGKQAIAQYFESQTLSNVYLEWEPEFVDAASSGDLGYTYGPYRFSATDANGKEISGTGVFHTVWIKGPDGKWRFVWD